MKRRLGHQRLDDRSAEALLSGRGGDVDPSLAAFVADLGAQRSASVPDPSVALAGLLAGGLDLTAPVTAPVLPRSSAWTRLRQAVSWRTANRPSWALPLQLGLGGAACLSLILGAAAANSLPAPVQTAVANVVEAVTPLEVPRPHVQPSPVSPAVPLPTVTPTEATPNSTDGPDSTDDSKDATTTHPSARPTEPGDDKTDGRDSGDRQSSPRATPRGDSSSQEPDDHATQAPNGDDHPSGDRSQAPTTRPSASPTPSDDPSSDGGHSGPSENG